MNAIAQAFPVVCAIIFVISLYLACAAFIGDPLMRPFATPEEVRADTVNGFGFAALASVSLWLAILTASW